MDPHYQAPAPQQDPYHFIMNTQHQPKKSMLPTNKNSLKGRLLLVGLIGGGLIIAVVLFSSLVLGGKDKDLTPLVSITAQQQEIIRVSELALKSAVDPSTLGYAETVKLSVSTQKAELISYLSKRKKKVTPVQLAAKKDASADKALEEATKNNRFDDAYIESIKDNLTEYRAALKSSYASSTSATAKSILESSYNSTEALLK